jgi:hypothetical protein
MTLQTIINVVLILKESNERWTVIFPQTFLLTTAFDIVSNNKYTVINQLT